MRRGALSALVLAAAGALATLAAAQEPPKESKWVRHYRERVAAFREENARLAEPAYAVFVGDSHTEGFALAKHFPGKSVLNRGIVADTTGAVGDRGILNRMEESVFGCRPRIVFVQIGGNDLSSSSRPPEVFVQGVARIVDAIRARLPKAPIVLHALMPKGRKYARVAEQNPRIAAFNEGIRALAKERRLALIDLHAAYAGPDGLLPDDLSNDGVHLKRDAYARWAELIRPHLE